MKAWGVLAVIAGLAAGPGTAEAAGPASKLVQKAVDPKTGAEIRVFRAGADDLTIEVEGAGVAIRKHVAGGRSEIALTTPADTVSVVSAPGGVVVRRGSTRIDVTRAHRERGEAARALLAGSTAVREAAGLLGRLGLGEQSPLRQSLMLTRAFLLSTWGDRSGIDDLRQWSRTAATRLRATRVALQLTAGECWAAYAIEAIAAYNEYMECTDGKSWYDLLDIAACALVYDVRAIGAFAWWLNCVSLMV